MDENTQSAVQALHEVLAAGTVRSVFQPIVELDSGPVVAYEALARGPEGPLASPDALFGAARAAGRLAELDEACRVSAFRGAADAGLFAPLTVFVNVEPEVLDAAPLADLLAIAEQAPGELRVIMEITERALAARPAELLRTVRRVRELGWGIALDDVGAESLSLAFMPLLQPDVIKLDLRLVQDQPGPAIAQIMNAVNATAERTGALILAEGIETPEHLMVARALGATLGQGWLFGRPMDGPISRAEVGQLVLPRLGVEDLPVAASPFTALPTGTALRRAPKSLLIAVSKQLEAEAARLGDTCVVASTFQEARHFTADTRRRYTALARSTGFVCALGEGLPSEPAPGVRGAELAPDDAARGEWDVVVISPHFSAALLARDLGDDGPDADRMFEFALTYQRETVVQAANSLMSRVAPRSAGSAPVNPPAGHRASATTAPRGLSLPTVGSPAHAVLHRALATTTSGVSIADMTLPDRPLVYVNEAFQKLSGYSADEVLGRNCRFMQGPETDAAVIDRMRLGLRTGAEVRETVLNHRGPARTPWWNEVLLTPVTDTDGTVLQYIGVQHDVSARVGAERELAGERDRAQSYLRRTEELAHTDPLTGLPHRRRLEEQVQAALLEAEFAQQAVALLVVDLDGFKAVNDAVGHAGGDEFLVRTAQRLRSRLRRGDLLARLGGDEFLVALPGLSQHVGRLEAHVVAESLTTVLSQPIEVGGTELSVGASIGISVFPDDAGSFAELLHRADLEMYARKLGLAAH